MMGRQIGNEGKFYARSAGVEERRVGAHVFLVDRRRDAIHSLDAVSGGIWRLLEQPRCQDEISAVLAEAFPDVPQPRLNRDVARVLSSFEYAGVIQPRTRAAAEAAPQKRKRLTRLT
jgi:Coenzyme PQQ synthesis protein D (PqqD)